MLFSALNLISILLSTALHIHVTISQDTREPLAGQPYFLLCSVTGVPGGLVIEPSLQWTNLSGDIVKMSNGYSIELSFSPLRTINGSHYTCKASVNITTTEMVNEMASTDLRVVSKCEKIQRMYVSMEPVCIACHKSQIWTLITPHIFFYAVPQPTVDVMRSHSDTVYVGTEITLTSQISLGYVSGVDEEISVTIVWTRDTCAIVSDTHTTVSSITGSGSSYTASLSFSPVNSSDHGNITATVTVGATNSSEYVETVTGSDSDILEIQGNVCMNECYDISLIHSFQVFQLPM